LYREQHRDFIPAQRAGQCDAFRSAPAVAVNDDASRTLFPIR